MPWQDRYDRAASTSAKVSGGSAMRVKPSAPVSDEPGSSIEQMLREREQERRSPERHEQAPDQTSPPLGLFDLRWAEPPTGAAHSLCRLAALLGRPKVIRHKGVKRAVVVIRRRWTRSRQREVRIDLFGQHVACSAHGSVLAPATLGSGLNRPTGKLPPTTLSENQLPGYGVPSL